MILKKGLVRLLKCIICTNDFEKLSDEHIFPDAIGGSLIVGNVCKSCNSKLGDEIDSLLTNHFLISLIRNSQGISGKSGTVPNPFKEGVTEDGQKVRLLMSEDGQFLPQYVPQLSEIAENRLRIVVDSKDFSSLPDIIRKTSKRKGVDIPEQEIQEIISNVVIESSQPKINYDFAIDTEKYKKALLKIAYEMGVYWLGDKYIEDPIGQELRTLIFSSIDDLRKSKIHGKIGLASEIKKFPFFNIKELAGMHLAILILDGNRLSIILRIFDVFAASIVLSENSDKYQIDDQGYFMFLDPVERIYNEMSFIEAIKLYMRH